MTREEFLQEYHPQHKAWAAEAEPADIKTPSDARIARGWVVEQPQHTYFNWHMHRTDERLAQLEARIAWLEKCLAEANA